MAIAADMVVYRPWILQRDLARSTLLLNLRRYEPKSGLLMGWLATYPYLVAAENVGERMLSLDFGTRQFGIEGTDLTHLVRHIQQSIVPPIQEYPARIWAQGRE